MPDNSNEQYEDTENDLDNQYNDIDQSNDFLDSDAEDAGTASGKSDTSSEEEHYGKRVQKRISQEVSKRKVLEDENRLLNNRVSDLESKFEQNNADTEMGDIDARMESLGKKRKDMYDVGDIDPDIEDQWQDLRIEKREAESKNKSPSKPAGDNANARAQNVAQDNWLEENEWYGTNGDKVKTDKANGVFQEMLDQGFNEQHPGTYQEFSKRMNTNADTDIDDDTDDGRGNPPPPPAAPTGGAPKLAANKGKLTTADFDMMTEMGLDPRNAIHRKQLLSNKKQRSA